MTYLKLYKVRKRQTQLRSEIQRLDALNAKLLNNYKQNSSGVTLNKIKVCALEIKTRLNELDSLKATHTLLNRSLSVYFAKSFLTYGLGAITILSVWLSV